MSATKSEDALYIEQLDLESKAVDLGVERYKELRRVSDPSSLSPEQNLIRECLPTMAKRIAELQKLVETGRDDKGRPVKGINKWGIPMVSLEPEKLALITLSAAINAAWTDQAHVGSLSQAIAEAVKLERYLSLVKKNAPEVLEQITRRSKKLNARAVWLAKRKAQIADLPWDKSTRSHLGAKLLEALIESTDAFVHTKKYEYGQSIGVVDLTDEAAERLETAHSNSAVLFPQYLPMVMRPNLWGKGKKGGYIYIGPSLVKTWDGSPDLEISDEVYDAINITTGVTYRLNQEILAVEKDLWEKGGNVAGLPSRDILPLPPFPRGFDKNAKRKEAWEAVSEEDRERWNLAASKIYSHNATSKSARKSMREKLLLGEMYKKRKQFWFSWQLDWRGREYPITGHINPQADDSGRALLEFAEGVPLGENGMYWLCAQASNYMGVDKVPFDARVKRIVTLLSTFEAKRWAEDPSANRGWTPYEDDGPFRLLATVKDIVKATAHAGRPLTMDNIRGYAASYVSHLPVAKDGSCNGLQHFSAMARDPIGAKAVNLAPSDAPMDIYSEVAAVVNADIEAQCLGLLATEPDAQPENNPCLAWRGRVTRKTLKTAILATPYGITPQGIREGFVRDKKIRELAGSPGANASYLKDVTYDAVGRVVVAARVVMDYLCACTEIVNATGNEMRWTTPDGFEVCQAYYHQELQTVRTTLQRISLRRPCEDRRIDAEKQVRGTPPNFVHSIDATHCRMLTRELFRLGVKHIQPVHDSFAVHAGHVTTMDRVIRETFVRMHSIDILGNFKREMEKRYKVVLPPTPPLGTFDLNQVLKSPYAFH